MMRGVDQHGDAALGQRADLGDRRGELVGGEGDGLGVEIAAGDASSPGIGEARAGCPSRRSPRSAGSRAAKRSWSRHGAHHLRLAAQANRGPARVVAIRCLVAGFSALPASSARNSAGHVDLAGLAAQRMDARVERAMAALRRLDAQRAGDDAPPRKARAVANRPASASAVETCVPLIIASPSLAASGSAQARPGRGPAARAASRRRRGTVADARAARRTDARAARGRRTRRPSPCDGITGSTSASMQREQRLDQHRAHARRRPRPGCRLQREDRAGRRASGSGDAHAGAVRQDEIVLQRLEVGGGDAALREPAEAGVDAIDRRAAGWRSRPPPRGTG